MAELSSRRRVGQQEDHDRGPGQVRRAGPEDAGVLAQLLVDFNTEFLEPVDAVPVLAARFVRLLSDPAVLAWMVGDAEGFALVTLRPAIWFDGPVAVIDELYVVPERRGQGDGTAVIAAVREALRERECPELHINVDGVDVDARRFYERHGFSCVEPGETEPMLCYIGPVRPA